jgi:uncharacterized protein
MQFIEDTAAGSYRINAYGAGGVVVNGETLTSSFLITSTQLIRDWPPQRPEELAHGHLDALLGLQAEILLIGTGARLVFPGLELLATLHAARIGFECMDSAAACRTFNLLAGEGRNVAAAVMML